MTPPGSFWYSRDAENESKTSYLEFDSCEEVSLKNEACKRKKFNIQFLDEIA